MPEWASKSGGSLIGWAKQLNDLYKKENVVMTSQQLSEFLGLAKKHNVNVRFDPPHSGTPWEIYHLNVGKNGKWHIAVPDDAKIPSWVNRNPKVDR